MKVAGVDVDRQRRDGPGDRFKLDAVDVRVDIVVHAGATDDAAELESLVLIVEGGCIEPQAAAEKAVLRSDLKRVHEFRIDRKSVVEGKSVSVRVDLGGSLINKQKKQQIIE